MTLADGRLLTMFGDADTIEVYDPATGTWGAPIALPAPPAVPGLDYRYYPWAYLLPGGDIFVGGHQGMSSRFSWSPAIVIQGQWPTSGDRSPGGGELGTSVLLPLRPPNYPVRVLNAAGNSATSSQQTAEMIDLSAASPMWMGMPNLQLAHPDQCTATLLPDGRVLLAGGTTTTGTTGGPLTAGPAEIFDPDDPAAGWKESKPMTFPRGYHSSAILLTDGSVLMGGDPPDAMGLPTPHERFFPGYCFLPRPTITNTPASTVYNSDFVVSTPDASSIPRSC